ncbi:RcnB family protein [uncultured Sphingomonas sp.]|uniref:RcnB family protein n=1 Tax=uncultured Sphingomonas sp. TaxID=158754 RepID=UPI0035CB5DFC
MRTVMIATTMLASAGLFGGAAQADQQRMVERGPDMGAPMTGGGAPPAPNGMRQAGPATRGAHPKGSRHWGGQYQGHWVGGMRAPGGWSGYRRPYRGFGLPTYWISPTFVITDFGDYGLYQPPVGYSWSRYYDDAVLIDGRGSVYDTVGGIAWNTYDLDEAQGGRLDAYLANTDSYRQSAGAGYAYPPQIGQGQGAPGQGGYGGQPGYGQGYPQGGYQQDGYRQDGYRQDDRQGRGSNGVGGAVIGGAAGGIAGGLIAGRNDKVGGALIGAGAGALAGYAIDRSAHRRDRDYADDRGASYPAPGPGYAGGGYAPGPGYPPPGGPRLAPPTIIESGPGTLVTTSAVGGVSTGTYVNGYYYAPATVTTVTIASAPVVTTTTEVFEDSVTYIQPAVHHYRKHVWHRPVCSCR